MTFDRPFENALALYRPASDVDRPAAWDRDTALRHWCEDYGNRWSWTADTTDLLEACGPAGTWRGAPTAVRNTTIRTAAIVAQPSGPRALLVVTAGTVHTARTTGAGSFRNPTPRDHTLLVAGLLDTQMAGFAPLSAICSPLLPRVGKAWAAAHRRATAGVPLGGTGERLVDIPEMANFAIYSAAPLDTVTRSALRGALEGWTGHLRVQSPSGSGSGLFLAWEWHGDNPSNWSAQADHTLGVLQAVRAALVRTSRT